MRSVKFVADRGESSGRLEKMFFVIIIFVNVSLEVG